jgi:hypothetical protein
MEVITIEFPIEVGSKGNPIKGRKDSESINISRHLLELQEPYISF